jgi:hypothetical protein
MISNTIDYLQLHSSKPPAWTKDGLAFGARIFYLAQFTLLGIGVGTSSDKRVMQFCDANAKTNDGKYNTWYFNSEDLDGDSINARNVFHWFPVKWNPIIYWSAKPFEPIRDQLPEMVAVAEKYHYLAFGCDGNKHRGPSVFAMFLCLAGVDPNTATKAANHFFGSNFVMFWVRRRIARLGWDLGNQNPELRKRLRVLMGLDAQ